MALRDRLLIYDLQFHIVASESNSVMQYIPDVFDSVVIDTLMFIYSKSKS